MERCCDDQLPHTRGTTQKTRDAPPARPPQRGASERCVHERTARAHTVPTRNKPRKKAHERNVAIERAVGRTSSSKS